MFEDLPEIESQFVSRDSFTMASIYQGISGNYYLIPAVGPLGIKGSKEALDSIIKSKWIPIEEKNPTIYQLNSQAIQRVNELDTKIVDDFFQKNGLNRSKYDNGDYSEIESLVKASKKEASYTKYGFELGILIGYKLKKKSNLKWMLEKQYRYNPYYVPILFNEAKNEKINPWYYLIRSMLEHRKFSFDECISMALIY